MDRFLARVVLVPFAYDPPPITPDVLDNLLHDAPAALPHALLVGKDLVMTESSTLRNLSTAVGDVLGSGVDGRLAMQYSLAILGAQTVVMWKFYIHTLYNSPSQSTDCGPCTTHNNISGRYLDSLPRCHSTGCKAVSGSKEKQFLLRTAASCHGERALEKHRIY